MDGVEEVQLKLMVWVVGGEVFCCKDDNGHLREDSMVGSDMRVEKQPRVNLSMRKEH
jgi:hypothetical protein